MIGSIDNPQELLEHHIPGFRQFVLDTAAHVSFASQNLCDLLGVCKGDLQSEDDDRYELFVHPADRGVYQGFMKDLRARAALCADAEHVAAHATYRLVSARGEVFLVQDSAVVTRADDGLVVASATLSDITAFAERLANVELMTEHVPLGYMRLSCEERPRILFLNECMKGLLNAGRQRPGEIDYLKLYQENMLLMLPESYRRRFALKLREVRAQGVPSVGELPIVRCDGTKGALFGYVRLARNEQGTEEFHCVCLDVSERFRKKKEAELRRYVDALSGAYDLILEFDRASDTVTCLRGVGSPLFAPLERIPMQRREATDKWLETVSSADRATLARYLAAFVERDPHAEQGAPSLVRYRDAADETHERAGIYLALSETVGLFCSRAVTDAPGPDKALETEIASLKNMQELVMRFADGIAAFEIADDLVTPLYASDNVCHFFGYSATEWLDLMKRQTPLDEFVSRSTLSYDDLLELFSAGEAEFSYVDLETSRERRIKVLCSDGAQEHGAPRYVMMYRMNDDEVAEKDAAPVTIRTFGYFDVFVNRRPIAFRSEKSKELFALLVDRRGGFVSSDEAIGYLWPDESANAVTLARYRKVALRLKNILEEYGIPEVIESVDGKRRIVPEKVTCDLYDYLSGNEEHAQLFKGSYLSNYSWGEITLGELAATNRGYYDE